MYKIVKELKHLSPNELFEVNGKYYKAADHPTDFASFLSTQSSVRHFCFVKSCSSDVAVLVDATQTEHTIHVPSFIKEQRLQFLEETAYIEPVEPPTQSVQQEVKPKPKYTLNGIAFGSKQSLIDYIQSDEFIPFFRKSLASPQKPDYVPSSGEAILRSNVVSNDGLTVTSELNKYYSLSGGVKYNWMRTYESVRYSGGNYSDESSAQKQAYFELDDIQHAVESKLESVDFKLG